MNTSRLHRPLVVTLCLLLPVLSGCVDQEAQEATKSRQVLARAVALVEEAEQGYVPVSNDDRQGRTAITGSSPQAEPIFVYSVENFREAKLRTAIEELESIKDSGHASQQVTARRLLAEIYGSLARETVRAARGDYATVTQNSATLISHVVAIQQFANSSSLIVTDQGDLLKALRDYEASLRGELTQLEREQAQWQAKIEQHEEAIAKHEQTRKEAGEQIMALRRTAATSTGEKAQKAAIDAIDQERVAGAAASEIKRLEAQLVVFRGELSIISRAVDAKKASLESTVADIKAAEEREAAGQTQAQEARDAIKQGPVTRLNEDYVATASLFKTGVDDRLVAAADLCNKAIESLNAAAGLAGDRAERQGVSIDLLGRRNDLVHVRTLHARMLHDFTVTLKLIADRVPPYLTAEEARFYTENAQRFAEQTTAAIAAAREALDKAREQTRAVQSEAGGNAKLEEMTLTMLGQLDAATADLDSLTAQ